jgi:lantibiotic modifying enzyme
MHRVSGVYYVHALVCHARGDLTGLHTCIEKLLVAAKPSSDVTDVTLGRAGNLIAMTNLLAAISTSLLVDSTRLAEATKQEADFLSQTLNEANQPGLVNHQPFSFAHGWAGILYATMFANITLGNTRPEELHPHITRRMEQLLASYKLAIKASTKFPADLSNDNSDLQQILIPGWCNGAAGMIPFLLLWHRIYQLSDLLDLASMAASEAFSNPNRQAHLCCGIAGRVFGLLAMFRYTGESRWLDKARSSGLRLFDPQLPPGADKQTYSLFWGALGCALTLEELQYPEQACMPLFADAAWPAA